MDDLTRQVAELVGKRPEPAQFLEQVEGLREPTAARVGFLIEVADRLSKIDKHHLAADVLRAALVSATDAGDKPAEADCLRRLGLARASLCDFEGALDCYEQSLALARSAGDRVAECRVLGYSAAARRDMGRYDEALRCFREQLAVATDCGKEGLQAYALCEISGCQCLMGSYDEAVESARTALGRYERLGDKSGEASCRAMVGYSLQATGEYRSALAEHKAVLAIYEETGLRPGAAAAHLNIGVAYRRLGDVQKALEHFDTALQLKRVLGHRAGEANCLINIGLAYVECGDSSRGRECQSQALVIARAIGDRRKVATCLMNLAELAGLAGDQQQNQERLNEAMEMAREIGDRDGVAYCLAALAESHLAAGDPAQALACGEAALAAAIEIRSRGWEAFARRVLGAACIARGDADRAGEHRGEALALYENTEALLDRMKCLGQFARANARCGRFVEALEDYQTAVAIAEQARTGNIPSESRSSFWKDNIGLFDGLVAAQVRLGDIGAALESSERGKGRTIHDLLIAREIEPDRFKPEPFKFDQMADLARRLGRMLVMFRVTESGTFAFRVTVTGRLDVVELPDFTEKRLGELVLQSAGGRPAAGWFGAYSEYRRAQDRAGKLLAERRLEEATALLRDSQQAWFATMESTLTDLSDELTTRVFEGIEPGARVALLPNRALNILPLHACHRTVEGRRRRLIEDYEISYAPNCSILDLCQRRETERDAAGQRLFAVANPVPPYELVFAEWEVEDIARHFDSKEVLVKADAKQALLRSAGGSTVLHLSTHGVHDIGSSFNSRLKLGRDEELTLAEVFESLRLERSPLVCLSTCESGLLDYRDVADEFVGLQAGFLYAGAPTVIASLWSITDYTTALVMMKTYEGIFSCGLTRAAALRRAQLWLKDLTAAEALGLLRAKEAVLEYSERMSREDVAPVRRAVALNDPTARPFTHPYYWAGYQLFGV